jgi:hypothetical protein
MNRLALVSLAAAVALAALAGCAATANPPPTQSSIDDREFRTGSRIPVRESSGSTMTTTSSDKQAIDNMMRQRGVVTSSPNN